MAPRCVASLILILVLATNGLCQPIPEQHSLQGFDELQTTFESQVAPLIAEHCLVCHNADAPEAELDLSRFQDISQVTQGFTIWEMAIERVAAQEMPPSDSGTTLDTQERTALVAWFKRLTDFESARNAGDPGPVLARRLNNAEYDYSVRDLTGVDIRPTRNFPIDPANEAGFDNSGESLAMSPALMSKYIDAAREVVDHLLLTPTGIRFAPHPVMTDTDRDKYCVKRIVAFYRRQPTDYADYFYAAWRYRLALNTDAHVSLEAMAQEHNVSPKFLARVWQLLSDDDLDVGPIRTLRQKFRDLPDVPSSDSLAACESLRDYVVETRREFEPHFDNLQIRGVHNGTQAFVLWKNKQYATNRRRADFTRLMAQAAEPTRAQESPTQKIAEPESTDKDVQGLDTTSIGPASLDLTDPSYREACEEFCSIFPDAFYVSERGRDYLGKPRDEQEKGRLLSAGFHSMMGYFRDDAPLCELILSDSEVDELDMLWRELNFITAAPLRQYQGFLWFDRTDSSFMREPQFDFARPEDQASLQEDMIARLAHVYLAKAQANGGQGTALQAIDDYFREINAQIRSVEQDWATAQRKHLDSVIEFAERAYRRPLTEHEQTDLERFYQRLRSQDNLSHEEAIQDTVVSILVSPMFCYRLDLLNDTPQPRELDDYELATRLSYFLWSSLPDDELLACARDGQLHEPQVLLQQTRRMLTDARVRGLAVEFGTNWLDVRRFETLNSVDRTRFPEFDDELRQAMFEEPVVFLIDMLQQNRSIWDGLFSNRTFVNESLARHYGMEDIYNGEGWMEIADGTPYGRGGLLTMAAFLTKNSPGLRTSPVKRGYWVVRRLLGEHIPPPPPNVPDLPDDESQLGDLTLREVLARHRAHESCAGCHDRFDSIGLTLEGFGPVGERRELDLGDRPVSTDALFPDQVERQGTAGLRQYIDQQRRSDYVDNLCRLMVSYGLGRTLQLSDRALLETIKENLERDDYRFHSIIETIVTSRQFLNKRGHFKSPALSQKL